MKPESGDIRAESLGIARAASVLMRRVAAVKPVVKLPLPAVFVLCCREAIDGHEGRLFGRNRWMSMVPPEEKKSYTGSAKLALEVATRAIVLTIPSKPEPLVVLETSAVDLAGC